MSNKIKQKIKKIPFLIKIYGQMINLFVLWNQYMLIKKLKDIYRNNKRKIRIGFLVTENEKWCCQTLFDKLKKHPKFEPILILSSLYTKDLSLKQEKFYKNHEFFKKACGDIIEVYDPQKDKFYSLKPYKLDIIFYQQPWGIAKEHSVLAISKFALACYVPYGFEESYRLILNNYPKFFALLFRWYLSHLLIEHHYKTQGYKLKNTRVVGYPKLEEYLNKNTYEKKYIIYAPHHAIEPNSLRLGTFAWNGHFILEYAKNHPQFNWVFKPHPRCKVSFLAEGLFKNRQELDAYYNEWASVGEVCETGNYIDLFKQTKCLITDCCSFLVEFFPTKEPVIHLKRQDANDDSIVNKVVASTYYPVFNLLELKRTLHIVLEKGEDPMRQKRENKLSELKLLQQTSDNIIKDLEKNFSGRAKN